MTAALAAIDREFSASGAHRRFKARIRCILRDPHHPAVCARYRARAEMLLGLPLASASRLVTQWYLAERRAFQLTSALGGAGRLSQTMLSLTILRELRLIARFMCRKRLVDEFPIVVVNIATGRV